MPSNWVRAAGLAAGLAAAGAMSAPAVGAPWSGLAHGKSKKPAAPAIPREGFWKLAAGASQEIFVNQAKTAVQVVAYVCVDPKPSARPVVRVEMLGRPAVEAPAGCQNVYLEVDSGDWIALVNPGAEGVSGSYKVAQPG